MSVLQIRAELRSFCVRNCPKDFSRGRGNGNHGKLLAFDVFASALGSLGVNKLPCAKGVDLVSARHKKQGRGFTRVPELLYDFKSTFLTERPRSRRSDRRGRQRRSK